MSAPSHRPSCLLAAVPTRVHSCACKSHQSLLWPLCIPLMPYVTAGRGGRQMQAGKSSACMPLSQANSRFLHYLIACLADPPTGRGLQVWSFL